MMKSLRLVLIFTLSVFMISCADGQWNRTVRGNGNVVKKERPASYFDGIRASSGIDVYLSQGDKESITVEADENLHEYIITEIKDGTLRVYHDNVTIREAERERVYVTLKDIKSLKTSSAGDIIGETPLNGENLEIGASSAGDIRVEVHAREVEVNISSAGDIKLSGEADKLSAELSSAGDLNAGDFKVREADVSVSSAGDANVFVTERLVARSSSAGNITYHGSPKYLDAHSSSAGGIHGK
jgi:hypothetical protein